jgi:hypothetical protein
LPSPQTPLRQVKPVSQSLAVVQRVRQVVPPQRKGVHERLRPVPATHMPVPLHVPPAISRVPVQVRVPHAVPAGWKRQAPAPSQPPARPQVEAAWATHSWWGSWPEGAGAQRPFDVGRLQA